MVSSNRVHGSCQKGHLEGRRWDGSSSVDKSTSRPELSGGNDVVLDLLVKRIAGLEMSTGRKGGEKEKGRGKKKERTNERKAQDSPRGSGRNNKGTRGWEREGGESRPLGRSAGVLCCKQGCS